MAAGGGGPRSLAGTAGPAVPCDPGTAGVAGGRPAIFSIRFSNNGLCIGRFEGGKLASEADRGADVALLESSDGAMVWKGLQIWER